MGPDGRVGVGRLARDVLVAEGVVEREAQAASPAGGDGGLGAVDVLVAQIEIREVELALVTRFVVGNAGGDAVTGAATVISAMGAGKLAAKSIDEFLSNK